MIRSTHIIVRGAALAALLVPLAGANALAAKSDAAKEKAAQAAELKKLVDKVEEAKKAGPLQGGQCLSLGDSFAALGKEKALVEATFNAGVLYAQCGDMKKAEQAYRDALTLNNQFAPAHANLGEVLYRRGDTVGAGMEFDQAFKADAKNVQAYNGQALILVEKAKATKDKALYTEAIGRLRRALALDADSMPAYALLALIYYDLAESDRAKLDLAALVCKQAKEVNEKYPPIYNTLGLINLKRKNVTGALKEFRTAAELEPRYIEAQLNIGAITLSVRDYPSAEKAFKAVLDANPTNPQQLFDATMGMGVALRGQRRVDEAEQWYSKAKALDAKACAVTYNLGVLYQDYKMTEDNSHLNKAKELFNQFLACGKAAQDKLDDGKRRIKDIDDTFKAIAEAKKMEEEAKKMQEEQAAIIKKANEDSCKYWKQTADEAKAKKQPEPPMPPSATGAPLRCRPDGTVDDSPPPAEQPSAAAPGAAPAPAPGATNAGAAPAPAPAPAPGGDAAVKPAEGAPPAPAPAPGSTPDGKK